MWLGVMTGDEWNLPMVTCDGHVLRRNELTAGGTLLLTIVMVVMMNDLIWPSLLPQYFVTFSL